MTDTIALYTGYVILSILGIALVAAAILVLLSVVAAYIRVYNTRKTIKLMKKKEAAATYNLATTAYDVLAQWYEPRRTMEFIKEDIERYRKNNNLNKI